jgi:iron complex outermembrane receptor protein
LPNAQAYSAESPTSEIANVRVVQLDASTIRVSVTGTTTLPKSDVTLKVGGLAYSLNPEAETPEEELVVTGDRQRGYRVPNASVGTRTDTPMRDTPASIQVIPQQVIRDQQVVRVEEALSNVSSVGYKGSIDARGYNFTIRGFDNVPVLRDGFRLYGGLQGFAETANLEQIEVLKGPASILYGDVQPGGVINLASKQPLSNPFHEVELQIGSRNFVRPRIDFTGPVTEDGKVLYRINALYQKNDSWRNYDTQFRRLSFAPSLTWKVSDRTDFTTFLEYLDDKGYADFGQIIIGNTLAKVPQSRVTNNPDDSVTNKYLRVGYNLEHRFSDNWKIRNTFSYQDYRYDYSVLALPFALNPQTNILNRVFADQDGTYKSYSLQTNAVGKFATGAIQHTLLVGVDLNRSESNVLTIGDFFRPRPFNIFAPNYSLFPKPDRSTLGLFGDFTTKADRLGVYIQDQLSFFENRLILLAGFRYDTIDQTTTNVTPTATTETRQQDNAVTPRIGVLYRFTPELAIYGSYSQSFNPNSGATISGDPLKPEKGEGFEAGIKAELFNRKLTATIAYFDLKKQNVAVADPQFFGFSIPTGEQRSRGVELDIVGEILPGWNVLASYAYTDAEITKDTIQANIGSRLSNIPKNSASLWTTYEIQSGNLKGLGFGVGFNYVGERFGGIPTSYRADSYFLTNAGVFYRTGKWRFAVNVRNLFNIDYVQALSQTSRVRGNYPGEPLTILGSVSVEF